MRDTTGSGASRRQVMQGAAGLAAAALARPANAADRPAGGTPSGPSPIMKAIPRTGESVPAIGLGTYQTFDLLPGMPRDHLQEVVRQAWEGGARVFDTSPLYGASEVNVGAFKAALGLDRGMFITNKIWSTGEFLGDDSHARRSMEQSQLRLWREKIDAFQCHSLVNVDVIVPLLKAWKKEGRIRYVGATHHEPAYFGILADWVEKGDLDMVQVHYSILERRAEERVLPAAQAKGTAVLVNMPLEKARLMKLVEGQPLPDFAAEFGARSWAQFFLKWVIAHPAITCAIPATANPAHAIDNMGALYGPLPDAGMRERMRRHVETLPGFADLPKMPWYPGKSYPGLIARARSELKSRS
ncbi:aldo/keto reductase [Methylobacterium terricola]|uniref:Aldo/keto reductase n=2 Tax=Methylobacterium terricola TaxID=2583531 RepID=A0A5C4L5F8_9HYPH|nr:aldo/keto reductase [Methylobacterium terricola]